jgi:hypothetical protein
MLPQHLRSPFRRERQEIKMPKLREIDIDYDQIRELVFQLAFSKKMTLIREIVQDTKEGY